MRILFVHSGYELYGSDRMLMLSIKAIKELIPESQITVFLPKNGKLAQVIGEELPFTKIEFPELSVLRRSDLKRFNFSFFRSFLRSVIYARRRMEAFDMVYVNSIVVLDYLFALRSFSKLKIVHVHEIPGKIESLFFAKFLKFSRASILFVSEASSKAFSIRNRAYILLNGLGERNLPKPAIPKLDGVLHVLMIGRINSWKGQDVLLNSLALMKPTELKKIEVVILGGVFEEQHHLEYQLKEFVRTNFLSENVRFVEFEENPSKYYNWSHVVAIPSKKPEPFGLVAIEAMREARATIAANHGGLREIVRHEETGFLIDPNSATALKDALLHLADSNHKVIEMGKEGNKRYNDEFTETGFMTRLNNSNANID